MDSPASSPAPVLQVSDLKVHFPVRNGLLGRISGFVRAVDGVSFALHQGETLGLVGESGCGKSTMARALLHLTRPTGGNVELGGVDLGLLSEAALRKQRLRMQLVFQNPHSSLNPRLTIEEIVSGAARYHGRISHSESRTFATRLLEQVGLRTEHLNRFPHEFSGGQRQRISIARALALQPEILVCDEAVSALDVSIQAQILNLLLELQQRKGLSYLFISHDLAVIQHIADRVAVMYLGQFAEVAPREKLFQSPTHPYTQALLRAIPSDHPGKRRPLKERLLIGDVPSPTEVRQGCAFFERCPHASVECRQRRPLLRKVQPEQWVACHKV